MKEIRDLDKSASLKNGRLLAACASLVTLLVAALMLTACQTDIDKNSTALSETIRPAAVVETANGNNQPGNVPIDPTKSLTLVAGATSTPGAATQASGGGGAAPTTAAAGGGAATTVAGVTGNATAGQATFRTNCISCHPSLGRAAGIGPNLTNSANAGDPNYIRNNIRNGKNAMPAFAADQVSDSDLENLVAYIISIRTK
jgi:mono/diheme cytochrome c family protein